MKKITKIKKPTALDVAHQIAKGFHEANIIDVATMPEFDVLCLSPVKDFSATENVPLTQ